MTQRIIVIGNGTAGAAAALMARKTDQKAAITIIADENLPEYSRCGLPYTVSKKVPEFEDVIVHPISFYTGRLIRAEMRLNTSATKIDVKAKKVQVDGSNGMVEDISYDALVIGTGSLPSTPPIKGLDLPHIYRLHTVDDARTLNSVARKGKQVAIIGAGLVGLETAEALHALGLKVTVIEFLSQVLPAMIDNEMGEMLKEKMISDGVDVKLGTAAKEVTNTHVQVVERESGKEENVPADLVLVATGVRANTDLATKAGISLGERGGILCDDRMMTNVKNVFAAGDCAEVLDLVTGQTVVSGLGSIALRQGEVAGQNAAGGDARFPGVVMARTTTLFGLEIAAVGPTTVSAEKANLSVLAGKFAGKPTSDYYPSDEIVTVRVLADKETGRFLGGQAIGPCAHQRVNVFSAALAAKMTIEQVAKLETCYAPPVAPIREPFLLAAQIVHLRFNRLKQKREKTK